MIAIGERFRFDVQPEHFAKMREYGEGCMIIDCEVAGEKFKAAAVGWEEPTTVILERLDQEPGTLFA